MKIWDFFDTVKDDLYFFINEFVQNPDAFEKAHIYKHSGGEVIVDSHSIIVCDSDVHQSLHFRLYLSSMNGLHVITEDSFDLSYREKLNEYEISFNRADEKKVPVDLDVSPELHFQYSLMYEKLPTYEEFQKLHKYREDISTLVRTRSKEFDVCFSTTYGNSLSYYLHEARLDWESE